MRFYYRVYLWPIVLIAFCTVGGICVFIGRYPWASLAIAVAGLLLGSVWFEGKHGVWPWRFRSKSNPEFDLDPEPNPAGAQFVTAVLKPYREKIPNAER